MKPAAPGPDPEVAERDRRVGRAERAEVLGARRRPERPDAVGPERSLDRGADPADQGRVVHERPGRLVEEGEHRHPILRDAGGLGEAGRDPFDRVEEPGPDRVVVEADVEPEPDLVGDRVVFDAAVDHGDREHAEGLRVELPADDPLEAEDARGREEDRVPRLVRVGRVPAEAADQEVDRLGPGRRRPLDEEDRPSGCSGATWRAIAKSGRPTRS